MRLTFTLGTPFYRFILPLLRYYLPVIVVTFGMYWAVMAGPPVLAVLLPLLAVVTAFVADNVIADRVRDTYRTWLSRWRFWVLPIALVVGSTMFLYIIVSPSYRAVGVGMVLALLIVSLWAGNRAARTDEPNVTLPHLLLSVTSYITVFLLYSAVYDLPTGATGQAVLIGASSFVLALEVYRQGNAAVGNTLIHAVIVAILMAQVAFALDYWPVAGMSGGIFLLLIFYAITGIGQSYFSGRLSRNTVFEFIGIMALGFVLLYVTRTWIV